MCRHNRIRRERRTPIIAPLLVGLGKAAYDVYQDHQQSRQQQQITQTAYQPEVPRSTPAPPPVKRHDSAMVREKQPRADWEESAHQYESGEVPGFAPPSYEDTVSQKPFRGPTIPGDHKHQASAPARPNHDVDDDSDTSSVFETTGAITPTTEMEANARQLPNNPKASASRTAGKAPSAGHSDLYNASHPRSEAAEIAGIARWLSQHSEGSSQAAHERDLAEQREVEELRRELSRASVRDNAANDSRGRSDVLTRALEASARRQDRVADKLEKLETKLAIKRAYREEKRDLRAAYRAERAAVRFNREDREDLKDVYRYEKDMAKLNKAHMKAELQAWKR